MTRIILTYIHTRITSIKQRMTNAEKYWLLKYLHTRKIRKFLVSKSWVDPLKFSAFFYANCMRRAIYRKDKSIKAHANYCPINHMCRAHHYLHHGRWYISHILNVKIAIDIAISARFKSITSEKIDFSLIVKKLFTMYYWNFRNRIS